MGSSSFNSTLSSLLPSALHQRGCHRHSLQLQLPKQNILVLCLARRSTSASPSSPLRPTRHRPCGARYNVCAIIPREARRCTLNCHSRVPAWRCPTQDLSQRQYYQSDHRSQSCRPSLASTFLPGTPDLFTIYLLLLTRQNNRYLASPRKRHKRPRRPACTPRPFHAGLVAHAIDHSLNGLAPNAAKHGTRAVSDFFSFAVAQVSSLS